MAITDTSGTIYTSSVVWPEWNIQFTQASAAMNRATAALNMTLMNTTQTIVTAMNNMNIWGAWNGTYTTNCTHVTCATNDWTIPAGISVATANAVNNAVWTVWADRYERLQGAVGDAQRIQRYSRRKLSEEELLAELEREKKLREEAEARALKARMAEQRAEKLLRACLSEQQIEDLEKKNCFYVEVAGRDGKRERYRIDRGSHGNVKQIDEAGSIIRSFCIQPEGVPIPDVMLTQKLYLEASDETRDDFWKTANITHLKAEKIIPHTVPRHERRRYAEANGLLH